jgi:hypothetical protein
MSPEIPHNIVRFSFGSLRNLQGNVINSNANLKITKVNVVIPIEVEVISYGDYQTPG